MMTKDKATGLIVWTLVIGGLVFSILVGIGRGLAWIRWGFGVG